jgi:alkanesulfonate monooxygenase SsuD/methylene tetrahydromethanopterin reductase-like flavin-dependent oxidoreductase (luciferase family)
VAIGTCIALAPLYNPIRLAEDAATIDLLSGGRLVLGLGNGYISREFDVLDVPRNERGKRTTETVEICKRAWTQDGFDFDGDVFSYSDLNVEPKPTRASGPPILLGGTSKPALKRAMRRADGHLGVVYYGREWSEDFSMDQFRDNVEFIQDQIDIGDEEFTISFIQYAHVADSVETAWEELLPAFVHSRRKYTEHTDQRKDTVTWDLDQLTEDQKAELRRGNLVGDSETIVAELESLEEQLPAEPHYIARMNLPSFPFEKRAETIRRFGDEVISEF